MDISRIGPFAVEERLGGDPAGTVFRAIHLQQKRSCALRIFPTPLVANTPAARNALTQEFEFLKKLKHPGIVRCYGGSIDSMHGYLAYELIDGESLNELLDRRERLSWEQVVDFAQQICDALEYAHQAGIVHEAISPDKLLIGSDGSIRISDFRQHRSNNPWCLSAVKRTPERVAYMAPELFRDQPVTPKADLYSLGCVMYRMLTGRPPFAGEWVEEIIKQHQEATAPPVSTLVFECPVWLDSLIGQLMEKDSLRRPHSASMVAKALLETRQVVASKSSVAGHLAAGFSPLTAKANRAEARELLKGKKGRKRKRGDVDDESPFYERSWFLAGCLLLLIGGVVTFVMWPPSEDRLYRQALALMETNDEVSWEEARMRYLKPLLQKFPNGQHAAWAQEQIDKLDMSLAEKRLRNKLRFGRELSDAEQALAEASNYEQFGDRLTAMEKYESIVHLFGNDQEKRPLVNIARRQLAQIEKDPGGDQTEYLQKQLERADQLAAQGNEIEARNIWKSIVNLYKGKAELDSLVEKAEKRIYKAKPEETGSTEKADEVDAADADAAAPGEDPGPN